MQSTDSRIKEAPSAFKSPLQQKARLQIASASKALFENRLPGNICTENRSLSASLMIKVDSLPSQHRKLADPMAKTIPAPGLMLPITSLFQEQPKDEVADLLDVETPLSSKLKLNLFGAIKDQDSMASFKKITIHNKNTSQQRLSYSEFLQACQNLALNLAPVPSPAMLPRLPVINRS